MLQQSEVLLGFQYPIKAITGTYTSLLSGWGLTTSSHRSCEDGGTWRFNPLDATLLFPLLTAGLIAARSCERCGRLVIKAEIWGRREKCVCSDQVHYIVCSLPRFLKGWKPPSCHAWVGLKLAAVILFSCSPSLWIHLASLSAPWAESPFNPYTAHFYLPLFVCLFMTGNSWNILKVSIQTICFIFWGTELTSQFLRSQNLVLNKNPAPTMSCKLSFEM